MSNAFLSANEIRSGLDRGIFTAEALVTELLERIRRWDVELNAFVETYPEEALEAARASDLRRFRNERKGPLDGVPFAVKDLFDVRGRATLAGSKALPRTIAATSAEAVSRLVDRGMVLLGKTQTVEFAYGSWGTNPSSASPVNPFDPIVPRVSGGSSSGSGVAVAAGFVPVALGTDTGGSVRTPAALCGVVGLKTTVGMIGRGGVHPLAWLFDAVGPMTRSVEDAALVLEALQGEDPLDPPSLGVSRKDPRADLELGADGLVLRHPPLSALVGAEEGVISRFQETLEHYVALGAVVEERPLPRSLEVYATLTANMITVEAWARYRALIDRPDSSVDPEIAKRMSRGKDIALTDYMGFLEQRRTMQSEFAKYMAGADAVLLPTSPITAKPIEGIHDTFAPFGIFTRFANLMDLAALSVPSGRSNGLPTGLQIVVRRFQDHLALRIGRALETHRGGLFVAPTDQI